MEHASFPTASTASLTTTLIFRKPRRIRFLARLLEALHHSRRLQAQRFLTTHRHLLDDSNDIRQQSRTEADDNADR
jgi:hypothetical protein